MNTQNEKLTGRINASVGKTKRAVGEILDDKDLKARGLAQKLKGQRQKLHAAIGEKMEEGSRALGGVLKRAGMKLEQKGRGK